MHSVWEDTWGVWGYRCWNPAGALPASSYLTLTTARSACPIVTRWETEKLNHWPRTTQLRHVKDRRKLRSYVPHPYTPRHRGRGGERMGFGECLTKEVAFGQTKPPHFYDGKAGFLEHLPAMLLSYMGEFFFKLSKPWFLCFQVIIVPTMETTGGVSASVDVKVLTAPGTWQACKRSSLAIIMSSSSSSSRSPRGFSYTSADRATCW